MFKKIYIEITNMCNLKCEFCIPCNRESMMMSVSNFEEVIKKVCKYTKVVTLHVKGEPFLHKNLEELLDIIHKYNLQVNITTNGTLIKEKLDILKRAKCIKQINFSLHSFNQNDHMSMFYLKNIFDCVSELSNITISYRLWNLNDIKENDVNEYIISELESYYKLDNLKEKLKLKNAYEINENIYINQDIEFTWPSMNGEKIIDKGKCWALRKQIAILVDGTVVPCCLDNNGDIPLGNIFESNLNSILNSEKALFIKNNFGNGKIVCDLCKTCGFLKRLENKRSKNKELL